MRGLTRRYGSMVALDGVDLDVAQGEFLTLLGPSGSGKTTLLMILAGFTRPDAGSIRFGGVEVVRTPPHKRNLGVVFQSYALFPHMDVAANVAFPLVLRGVNGAERTRRVNAALELVQLGALGGRRVQELSGGQRQRVALARAIVFEPGILLMDEPLSALDKKLREQMQIELRHLHRRLGTTVIYVTHDQREALTMSDRVAVIDHGRVAQIDTPRRLYEAPASHFVADFIGDSTFLGVTVSDGVARWRSQTITPAVMPSGRRLALGTACGEADNRRRCARFERVRRRGDRGGLPGRSVRIDLELPGGEQVTLREFTRSGRAQRVAIRR